MANLSALADRLGINTLVDMVNKNAENMDSFRVELYYDQMMLDEIKIKQENYIFLNYAKSYSVPKGHEKWTIRRNFPLTEHTVPLMEGIPPRSDKTKKERIEGVFHQYGRYMEFSDRVDWKLLDPIMLEYSQEYGDVAVRTMHRLARKELLSTTFQYYAKDKTSIGELKIGDTVGLAEFRLVALKFSRLLVNPIEGVYHVITSEEHYWDLMKDELIIEYIGANNGLSHYKTGEIPELFGVKFRKTQFDDYNYGYELSNPGEYMDVDTSIKCRVFINNPAYDPAVEGSEPYLYFNLASSGNRQVYVAAEYRSTEDTHESYKGAEEGVTNGDAEATESTNRLSDGSWIPVRTIWTLSASKAMGATPITVALSANQTTETQLGTSMLYYTYVHATTTFTLYLSLDEGTTFTTLGTIVSSASTLSQAQMDTLLPTARQLPVHRAIMLGEGALAKIEVTGEGNVKMFAKPKGSAGVLDPIDQRQSIGFKINTMGFKLVREEACWVFNHVPSKAAHTAGLNMVAGIAQNARASYINSLK